MNQSERNEIDCLLSQIADEGASREAVEQLAALLIDRPELQEHYAQAMRLHMMLTHEMGLASPALKPVVPRPDCRFAQELGEGCSVPDELVASLGRDPQLNQRTSSNPSWSLWIMAATAAMLSMVAFGYGVWLAGSGLGVRRSSTADLRNASVSEAEVIDGEGLMVRDVRTMKVVSRLTRTSLLTSMVLPNCQSSDSREINLCSGVAWMERSPGDKERGYLLALPPGMMLDLYVDTDAEDQNALAVVEIDPLGRMTGGTISFSNVMEGNDDSKRRAGSIGNYSVFNDTSFTKYFLFAGSHVLPRQAAEDSWYQSDYQVQHESEDLLVIGWDDSGYSGVPEPTYGDFTPDRDYNDIRAIVRLSRPGESRVKGSGVVYSPQPQPDLPVLDESDDGYVFDVKPGDQLVVMVSASALMPNSMYVIELPSRKVMWKLDGVSSDGSLSPDLEKGTLIIRNDSDTVRQYQLHGRYQPGTTVGDTAWQALPYKVLAEGDGSVTVGYEDSIGLAKHVDWNDIRVHARWFSD